MTIAQRIDRDLTEALKAREAERLGALRMVKTALKLRETEVPGSLGERVVDIVALLGRFPRGEQGGEVVKMSSAEFGRLMVSEQNKWLEVIRIAGIKGE